MNGTYNSVSGLYGSIDGENGNNDEGVISFYGDGILLKSFNVTGSQLPKNFTLNIAGVSQLTIEFDATNDYFYFGIGDIAFK